MREYSWVAELATECRPYSSFLGTFLAKAVTKVTFDPVSSAQMKRSWAVLTRDMVHLGFDPEFVYPPDIDATINALEFIGIDKFNHDSFDEKKLALLLEHFFDKLFKLLSESPQIIELINQADLVEDIVETMASRLIPIFKIIPVFSHEAEGLVPYLKEPLFTALYELNEEEHLQLTMLTEKILHQYYEQNVRVKLTELLKNHIKGRNLLLPLIDQAVKHLPPDRCMTSLIRVLCTPKSEYGQGRIISIVLQELGGMYVKLAQVLAELAPPTLAKELRHQQDRLGGIFGSQEKSWNYVLDIFERPSLKRLKNYLIVPELTQSAFAGASVGAIYEFELTEQGKTKLHSQSSVLIKIQRPGLKDLFESQKNTLIRILTHLDQGLPQSELAPEEQSEISALITALKRTIINYASQSMSELDFRIEKKNAQNVREALTDKFDLQVPQYYHVEEDVLIMEKITGEKITSVVHSRYLERMSIADTIADAYLYLMFQKGLIWADPHAGNILYDPDSSQVKLIDLNPCFSWDRPTIKVFISFIYRLILSDHKGIISSLELLVENPEELKTQKTTSLIKEFIQAGNQGAFIRYLADFVRLLGEANINLRIEVQAALRGLSQIYLTSGAISSTHNFGQVFQKQFGWKMLLRQILSIGPIKIIRAALPLVFDVVRNSPEQEVGPTLDERDLFAINESLQILTQENVCFVEMHRTSPDENSTLTLSSDGSSLIKSTNLRLEVLTETRPASVKYIIEIPSKEWLKERQEYVRLQGIGYTMCLVECLEQLRRQSLEEYWHVVEGWNLHSSKRSIKVSILIAEVRVAARSLFARRYQNIWVSDFMTISRWNRILWKLMIAFETRFERREQGHFFILSKSKRAEKVGQLTFGTIHRLKVISYRLIISWLKTLIRKNKFEMNLLPVSTDDLTQRMMHGLLRRGLFRPPQ